MLLMDGNKLAEKIQLDVKKRIGQNGHPLRLAIVVVGENPVVKAFIARKRVAARALGVETRTHAYPETITTAELRRRIAEIVHAKKNDGVIVQLPLPVHVNPQYILNAIPPEKDVDVLSARALGNFVTGKSPILPPVAGAVRAFLEEYEVDYRVKHVVVVGGGVLVGRSLALWLLNEKVTFSVVRSTTARPEEFLRAADIVITGVGKPGFLTGDMIKNGAVVLDAGTSESSGKVVGDVDGESVSKKAAYLTPVPGGIGPVTVAMLFKNLAALALG